MEMWVVRSNYKVYFKVLIKKKSEEIIKTNSCNSSIS